MCRPTVVFHVERGLSWVELAQRKQQPLLTSLCSLSCFTVSISFYITFLPLLVWVRCPTRIRSRLAVVGFCKTHFEWHPDSFELCSSFVADLTAFASLVLTWVALSRYDRPMLAHDSCKPLICQVWQWKTVFAQSEYFLGLPFPSCKSCLCACQYCHRHVVLVRIAQYCRRTLRLALHCVQAGRLQLGTRLVILMSFLEYVGNGVKDLICAPRPMGHPQGAGKTKLLLSEKRGGSDDAHIHSLVHLCSHIYLPPPKRQDQAVTETARCLL